MIDDGLPTTSPPPPTDEIPLEVPSLQTPTHKIAPQSPRLAETSSAASFQDLGWTDGLPEENNSNITAEVGGIGEVIPGFENPIGTSLPNGLGVVDEGTRTFPNHTSRHRELAKIVNR